MLKKIAIAGAATAVAMLCVGGVAYADASPNCSSHETTKQKNKGPQLVGGNVIVTDINGFIGGEIDKGAVCPAVLNDNKAKSKH